MLFWVKVLFIRYPPLNPPSLKLRVLEFWNFCHTSRSVQVVWNCILHIASTLNFFSQQRLYLLPLPSRGHDVKKIMNVLGIKQTEYSFGVLFWPPDECGFAVDLGFPNSWGSSLKLLKIMFVICLEELLVKMVILLEFIIVIEHIKQ